MKSAVWFWGTGGAGSRVMIRVAGRLAETFGAPATALLIHRDNDFLAAGRAAGYSVFTVSGAAGHGAKLRLLLSAPWRALRLFVALLSHRPRVVIIPMNFALACPLALIPRLLGCKLIYFVHDAEPHSGDFAPGWQRMTQRWLIARSQRVVAMSRHVAERLLELHPDLSPGCLDVVPLHMLARSPRRGGRPNPDGPLRFLFVGRLLHYKGLDLLAQALALLPPDADWRLTIAGDGPQREQVLSWFGGMANVDLTRLRWLEEDEIESLIDSHDIMICPYRDASQSGSIVEALYAGMPSLVTPSGALTEQINHGSAGWITAAATPEAIAATLSGCIAERDGYAERSAAAAAFAQAELAGNAWSEILAKTFAPREVGGASAPAPEASGTDRN
ncbi:glycosyltransferase family 4 protein [Bosea sp. BK604]|uniref:glycosyltransferase family 4 protein n=1 Tax=Bosea sp. BK604 TaxID=2512180 RepID=UPI0010E90C45|nr:glycosyltransferase family 4 protein [Bosea sp. BK604]TCR70036.1 glycosyltransferase involved in cell wall biosynthesis [Bosea sp. BK604]